MKKILTVCLFIVLSITLTGCGTAKTPGVSQTKIPSSSDNADTSTSVQSATASDVPQFDTATVESTYQTNYTQATTSVNTYLQNQAQFCSVVVEFPQNSAQNADETFYFSSTNDQIKDWYGAVEIDPLQKIVRRMLAAKKDYSSDITCMASPSTTPPGFMNAYQSFLQMYPQAIGAAVAKTKISLIDTMWNITAWDSTGAVIATAQEPLNGTVTTSTSATATISTQ